MRWFFSLLLLTNLALAGWFFWQSEAPQPVLELPKDSTERRLQLLSELPRQSLQPIRHEVNTPETPPPTNNAVPVAGTTSSEPFTVVEELPTEDHMVTCVRVSPIANAADAKILTRKFEQANLTVLDSGEGFTERQTYWVMIPPYTTEKAARDAAAQLAKAKVRDFLVVRSGEFEKGISLGLFSQKEGAENRLREINALKLHIGRPEMRLRTSSVRSHWLITQVKGDDALKALQIQLEAEGVLGTPVECPAITR